MDNKFRATLVKLAQMNRGAVPRTTIRGYKLEPREVKLVELEAQGKLGFRYPNITNSANAKLAAAREWRGTRRWEAEYDANTVVVRWRAGR